VNFDTAASNFWYNSSSTSGPITPPKWSGNNSSTLFQDDSNGWLQSRTLIPNSIFNTAGNLSLRWRFGTDTSGQYEGFAIDDIHVWEEPSNLVAPAPVVMLSPANGSSNLDPETVNLDWSTAYTGGTPELYAILISNNQDDITGQMYFEVMHPITKFSPFADEGITLSYDTRWYWSILPVNTGGYPNFEDCPVWFFNTCLNPTIASLPRSENFDGVVAPALPIGWKAIATGTSISYVKTVTTSTPYTAPNHVYLYNSTETTANLLLVSPHITVSLHSIRLKVWVKGGGSSYSLFVGTMSNPLDANTFTTFSTITPTTAYAEYTVEFSTYAGTDQYIAFKHGQGGSSRSIYLDNVSLSAMLPDDISAVNLTGNALVSYGVNAAYTLTVKNEGTDAQSAYSVKLMTDSRQELANLDVTTPLASGDTAVHTLNWTPNFTGNIGIYGKVVLAGDQNASNDVTATKPVTIFGSGSQVVTVGNQASTLTQYYFPMSFYYKNSVTETIFFEDELQLDSGTISAIVYKNNFTQELANKPVKIWIGTTTLQNLSTGWLSADIFTQVFDGTVSFPTGTNEIIIQLQTPYNYTGGNLVVRVNRPMDTANFASTNYFIYTNSTNHPNRSRYLNSDTVTYDPLAPSASGTISSYVPNTYLVVNNAVTWPRINVTGRVFANDMPDGLSGVVISLTGVETYNTTTGPDGSFQIANVLGAVTGRQYTLSITKSGYMGYNGSVTVFNTDLNTGSQTLNEIAYPVYNVLAAEVGNNVQLNWDPAGPPPGYSYNFDLDNGGWVPTSNWSNPLGDWQWTDSFNPAVYTDIDTYVDTPPTACHSGTGMWGTVIQGGYSNCGGWSYLRKTFDLSSMANPTLTFWHYMNGYNTWDYGLIKVNGNTVWGTSASAVFMPWQQLNISLAAYASMPSVQISFEWYATSTVSYAGWYLDDIYIGQPRSGLVDNRPDSPLSDRTLLGYNIFRMLAADEGNPANWTQIATGITQTNYNDTAWSSIANGTYKWALKAVYTGGLLSDAVFSNQLVQNVAITAPTNVVITASGTNLQLSWNAVTNAVIYKVYGADNPYADTPWTYVTTVTAPATSTLITSGADFKFYYVTALNSRGESLPASARAIRK